MMLRSCLFSISSAVFLSSLMLKNVAPTFLPYYSMHSAGNCPNAMQCRCYINKYNYLCCNPMLELFMELTLNNPFNQLKWKLTNKNCAAAEIQRAAQQLFNTSFESFVSESEICGKNNFRGDLMCKIRTSDGKAVMMYATPVPYSIDPCCPSKPLS